MVEVIPQFEGTRIVRLTVRGDDITTKDLQQVRFRDLRRSAVNTDPRLPALEYLRIHPPRKGPGNLDVEFYRMFAVAYLTYPYAPSKGISEELGVPMSRVKTWAMKARALGCLAPTRRGLLSHG